MGLGLIAWQLFFNEDKKGAITDLNNDDQQGDQMAEIQRDFLEGVLYQSEDPTRGNLKLLSEGHEVFIKTSRDFSSLVGFQVLVFMKGTIDNFELLDIQPKVENEGYLLH